MKMNIAEIKTLGEELKRVSGNLALLCCVIEEGMNGDTLTPEFIADNISVAREHLDRIANDMTGCE